MYTTFAGPRNSTTLVGSLEQPSVDERAANAMNRKMHFMGLWIGGPHTLDRRAHTSIASVRGNITTNRCLIHRALLHFARRVGERDLRVQSSLRDLTTASRVPRLER